MNLGTINVRLLTVLALAGVASLSPAALAQQGGGLGGPKVKDEGGKGQQRKLSGEGEQRQRPEGQRPEGQREGQRMGMPHRGFLRGVLSLNAEATPKELNLTSDQTSRIEAINREYIDSVIAFRDTHAQEIATLREQLPMRERRRVDAFERQASDIAQLRELKNAQQDAPRPERGQVGGKPEGRPGEKPAQDGMDDMQEQQVDEAAAAKARESLRALMEQAPKPAQAHEQILAVLTDAQKAHVRQQGEKMREPRPGTGEGQGQGRPGRRGNPGAGGDGGEGRPMMTDEQREKLRAMSPEERREFLRTLREQREKDAGKDDK